MKEEHFQTTHWCSTANRPAVCGGKSMISCGVYRDLILLYVSGECGDDTKELVKAHLSQCTDCRTYYEELAKPLTGEQAKSDARSTAEPAAPAGPSPSAVEDNHAEFDIARKVTKGLKKKWIVSLTAGVAAILLTIGLCILTVNQIRGDGLCFTSMDDRYYAKKFFQAIQDKDYEKAFSFIDVAGMYSEIRETGSDETAKAVQNYEKAVIGETEVYLNREAFLNDYQTYMENRDEAAFWIRMMLYNEGHRAPVDIPEHIFQEAAAKLAMTDSSLEASSEDTPDSPASGYTLTTLESGEKLYTLKGVDGAEQLTLDEPCILAAPYEKALDRLQETQRVMTACAQYYEAMGFEKYKELVWEDFLGRMQKLEAAGIRLKQISVSNSYRQQDSDGRECWQVEVTVGTSEEGSGSVTVMTRGSALRVGGGVGLEGAVDTLAQLTRASADPSGFYAKAYE